MAFLCAASSSGTADSGAVRLHAVQERQKASIEIVTREGVACEHRIDSGTLWLRCDGPIDVADAARIGVDLADWLQDVRYGYDSLLLIPRGTVDVRVERETGTTVVEMRRTEMDESSLEEARSALRLREQRVLAVIAMERGDLLRARAQLQRLADAFPNDVDLLLDLADAESRMGRWRRAILLYDRVLSASPGSERAARGKAAALRRHGPQISASGDWQTVEDEDRQWIWQLDARLALGGNSDAVLDLELRDVEDDVVKRASGTTELFAGVRQRGSIGARVDHLADASTEVDLLWGPNGLGLAVHHERRGNWGMTTYHGELNRAYWNLVEGLADEGSVSRVLAEHRLRSVATWNLDLAAGWSQYGIDGDHDVARSWQAAFGVQRGLLTGPTTLGIAYRFDTERVYDREHRTDAAGEPFAPLPLLSRELHVFELAWSGLVTDYVQAVVSGGYSIDRLNSQGPFVDAALKWEPIAGMEIGIRVNHSIAALRGTGQTVTRLGAYAQLQL